jgi:hypothetical protein
MGQAETARDACKNGRKGRRRFSSFRAACLVVHFLPLLGKVMAK